MSNLPYVLTRREDCGNIWYARVKTENGYTSRKSTGTTSKKEAERIALDWYRKGFDAPEKAQLPETVALIEKIRHTKFSVKDAEEILKYFKSKHLITTYTLPDDKVINAYDYLMNFWDYNNSPYVKEKHKRGQRIGKKHCFECCHYVRDHFQSLKTKYLQEITRQDVLNIVNEIDDIKLSPSVKNRLLRSLTTPLKWAFNNEIIPKDITKGVVFYANKSKERIILTPETVQALFSVQWEDNRSKLANLLAMCTGMRAGEILALRLQDLGEDCIYVRHSYNRMEGLKCTKNGEERIAYLPFPFIIDALKRLGETNPYDNTLNAYIFYAAVPDKPIEEHVFMKALRNELTKLGVENANQYTFHAWRHYFATYMKGNIDDKILQQQTGHKSIAMLEHYSNHKTQADVEKLENAQKAIFGDILNNVSL